MHRNDPKRFYELVMDSKLNPLSRIPDLNVRHMVMQLLAWMWCIVFSSWVGSILVFGISALVHAILLAGVFMTLATFEAAKRRPSYFGGFALPSQMLANRSTWLRLSFSIMLINYSKLGSGVVIFLFIVQL